MLWSEAKLSSGGSDARRDRDGGDGQVAGPSSVEAMIEFGSEFRVVGISRGARAPNREFEFGMAGCCSGRPDSGTWNSRNPTQSLIQKPESEKRLAEDADED